jgi:hypothetical protein
MLAFIGPSVYRTRSLWAGLSPEAPPGTLYACLSVSSTHARLCILWLLLHLAEFPLELLNPVLLLLQLGPNGRFERCLLGRLVGELTQPVRR